MSCTCLLGLGTDTLLLFLPHCVSYLFSDCQLPEVFDWAGLDLLLSSPDGIAVTCQQFAVLLKMFHCFYMLSGWEQIHFCSLYPNVSPTFRQLTVPEVFICAGLSPKLVFTGPGWHLIWSSPALSTVVLAQNWWL